MKKIFFLFAIFTAMNAQASKFEDLLEKAHKVPQKARDLIIAQDVNFDLGLGNIDLINGINLSAKGHYQVEASYIDKYYTRVDKWDVLADINVGDLVRNAVDIPFSFSVSRQNSFLFARQFPTKKEALLALPYSLKRLPINADAAIKNLAIGDFVSMPANLSVAFKAEAATTNVAPIVIEAKIDAYYVINGEFTVQVFKLDETHVRLKLITKKSTDMGANIGVGLSTKFFGVRLLDHQIDRILDRDLATYGYSYNPGAQFIIDYIFDLKDTDAKAAYNQILSSTIKFKDTIILKNANAKSLKDRLISSYEKADDLFFADKLKDSKDRRVQRIFKGFNDYKGHTNHLKFSLLVAGHIKDTSFTESKVTFVDKNENNMEFFYPTYSKYIETKIGKFIFEYKDQSFQNNFGVIPRFNLEDSRLRNPDLGMTFERKDKFFTNHEQRMVDTFMMGEMPEAFARKIHFPDWNDGSLKRNTKIFFQLILKAQAIDYLKNIPRSDIRRKLEAYIHKKNNQHVLIQDDVNAEKLKNFLLLNRKVTSRELDELAGSLSKILKNETNNSEVMLKNLITLNEKGIFDKIGLGFLISLLPENKLEDLVYLRLKLQGQSLSAVNIEIGSLNYRTLYKELNEVQSRLSNLGYDLRFSSTDQEMESIELEKLVM